MEWFCLQKSYSVNGWELRIEELVCCLNVRLMAGRLAQRNDCTIQEKDGSVCFIGDNFWELEWMKFPFDGRFIQICLPYTSFS